MMLSRVDPVAFETLDPVVRESVGKYVFFFLERSYSATTGPTTFVGNIAKLEREV